MRRGDDPDVDLFRRARAQRLERPLLKNAQQLDLRRQWQLRNLVEKHGPAVGDLEAAVALAVSAGERPARVAEQFGLHQRLGEGAAWDGHVGAVAARASIVDQAGNNLLAGSTFADDQHRRVVCRHDVDRGEHPPDGRRLSDEQGLGCESRQLGPGLGQFALQRPLLGYSSEQRQQAGHLEGLGQVVVGALLERGDRLLDVAETRDQDDVCAWRLDEHPAEERLSVDLGKLDVRDDDVEGLSCNQGQALLAIGSQHDLVTRITQGLTKRLAKVGLVLHQEKAKRGQWACASVRR